jgi:hypothetical protein
MKGINPSLMQIFYAAMAVVGVIATMTPAVFPSYIPSADVTYVIQTSGFIVAIYSGVSTVLARLSSSDPGQWVQQDPPVVQAATKLADLPGTTARADVEKAKQDVVSLVSRY